MIPDPALCIKAAFGGLSLHDNGLMDSGDGCISTWQTSVLPPKARTRALAERGTSSESERKITRTYRSTDGQRCACSPRGAMTLLLLMTMMIMAIAVT